MPFDESLDVTFVLKPEEQRLILTEAIAIDDEILGKLRVGIREKQGIRFTLPENDFEDLLDGLASEANHATPQRVRRQFERLYDRLNVPLTEDDEFDEEALPLPPLPPDAAEPLRELMQRSASLSKKQFDAEVEKILTATLERPREELCGLSFSQIGLLLASDWKSKDSIVRLDEKLPLAAVQNARFFHNARLLLQNISEAGRVKATGGGNLNRKFVYQMLDVIQLRPAYFDPREIRKAINEVNVLPLYLARIVAGFANLIRVEKGYFVLRPKGVKLLKENKAGDLYKQLFTTFFRKLNLSILDVEWDFPEVQDTLAFSLYALAKQADDWTSVEDLLEKAFLPGIAAAMPELSYGGSMGWWILRHRILLPLNDFGLLEIDGEDEDMRVKKTPLFDRFISFDLTETTAP